MLRGSSQQCRLSWWVAWGRLFDSFNIQEIGACGENGGQCVNCQKTLVQRVCCDLVITPECNALSHTLQNTCHFSTRLRLCLEADSEMMWRIWRLVIIKSERVGPVVVLIHADFIALAEHISEVIPTFTLCNYITTEWLILNSCNFPVVTKLLKNLCFGVVATHGVWFLWLL